MRRTGQDEVVVSPCRHVMSALAAYPGTSRVDSLKRVQYEMVGVTVAKDTILRPYITSATREII